ncbi:hypothetical protein O6H91_10G032800 [Diphasiastrum complanatum]|uniref:Uncharacterized protein n=2 Tax=Diphasiastrum complanatum TaxID=34168 RepID=A0ACC2CFQ4_DIPCM|nr:hypothetical protein O6H91_10G032800 [Diphasiastrum complanatum]KAJ7540825.1 hypothetical protein O6H91_10G032800 [Diphasiastrum complanatum]
MAERSGDGGGTPILLLFFIFLCLASILQHVEAQVEANVSYTYSSRRRSSVLSLFNLKGRSKYWSEKLLWGAVDEWERPKSPRKGSIVNYTDAGNIANYLNLGQVDAIYLPVPVNFIFIGFDGSGNHGLKLEGAELERWFKNLDHVLEHTRVPQLGESFTPFYQVKANREQKHNLPLVSYTHYNYSIHVVEMGERVTSVFERAIQVLSRKEDLTDKRPDSEVLWQVDVDGISYLFTSLLHYLKLDNAYSIFILNPKRNATLGKYGYRRGLSESEIDFIRQNVDIKNNLQSTKPNRYSDPLGFEKLRKPLYERHPMLKFSRTAASSIDMDQWVDRYLAILSSEQSSHGKPESEVLLSKTKQLMNGRNRDLASIFWKGIKSEQVFGLKPECLVDTWVGKERWAFVDLTAGPFSWGPAVGGEGVRTEKSLPSVEESFGKLPVTGEVPSDAEAQEDLQNIVEDRFSMFGEETTHAVDLLLAEIDIYELFAYKHCRGRKIKITLCQDLQERIDDMQQELETFRTSEHDESHQNKAMEALKRIEAWNLFGDIHEQVQNFSVARDSFLAHMGATLSSAMKHVITPSTSDGAYHYYEKINFQLYIVTEEKLKHPSLLPLDLPTLKEALSSLIIDSAQRLQFGIHMLSLSEDPALAVAFSVARRTTVLPVLLVNGTYKLSTRVYIDSLILEQQLQQLGTAKKSSDSKIAGKSALEIPIFWFVRTGEPLFVDKHHLAKALPDMVIVVQTSNSSWESHLQCNGKSILWDLSLPIKAAVAATAEHLAGLLPSHLTYSHAHENAAQDWTWEVGCHPFASTSDGWNVSYFQNDAVARSYIVTAIDESIENVNEAIEILLKEPTYAQSFQAFSDHEYELLRNYNSIVAFWKRIALATEELHFGEAVKLLPFLSHSSEGLMKSVAKATEALHPIHCTRKRKFEAKLDAVTGIALFAVLVVVGWMFRPRRIKPKIN